MDINEKSHADLGGCKKYKQALAGGCVVIIVILLSHCIGSSYITYDTADLVFVSADL